MKKLVSLVLVAVMSVAIFSGCSNNAPEGTVADVEEPTGLVESELVTAVREHIEGLNVAKKEFASFELGWNDSVKTMVGSDANLSNFSDIDPNTAEIAGLEEGSVRVSCEDPKIPNVGNRLTYLVSGTDGESWSFFADFDKESECLKWLEIDPMVEYDDSKTMSINGVNLSGTFDEVILMLGTPDTIASNIKGGKDVICLSWQYALGAEEPSNMYVSFENFDGTDPANAHVDNIYVDMGQ